SDELSLSIHLNNTDRDISMITYSENSNSKHSRPFNDRTVDYSGRHPCTQEISLITNMTPLPSAHVNHIDKSSTLHSSSSSQ
ncbi:hypothetical protein Tco_0558291, partial [Tanacetum coccineum]